MATPSLDSTKKLKSAIIDIQSRGRRNSFQRRSIRPPAIQWKEPPHPSTPFLLSIPFHLKHSRNRDWKRKRRFLWIKIENYVNFLLDALKYIIFLAKRFILCSSTNFEKKIKVILLVWFHNVFIKTLFLVLKEASL